MADQQGIQGGSGGSGGLVGQSLGEYLLRGVLGVGGMAEVYRAMDLTLEREVAVKVLPANFAADPGYVRRFRDEAKQVAALNHPHIVPIYAFGEEHGYFYHVMPMLHGSLRDRLIKDGKLAPEEAVRLVRQVASALGAAHALGLVHRDVKPENILLDAEDNALLTDFGIAREMSALREAGVARTLARTGMPVGTPEYMAPEQLRAEPCDQRADIYGLGAVLYELLTGVAPHEAASPFEVAALVLSSPILPPSQRNPRVWPALEQTVLKALALDAADRYPDMQSFAAALELALHRTDALWTASTLPPVAAGRATRVLPLGLPLALPAALPAALKRPRTLATLALAAVLVVAALGTGILALRAAGNGKPSATGKAPIAASTATATATTAPTATPKPTATATTPAPPPAPPPSGPLSFSPAPLILQQQGPNCTVTQTITNAGAGTLGWFWQNPPSGFQYSVNGRKPPKGSSLVGDVSPGIPPGGQDTLTVTGPCMPMSKTIVATDTHGNDYAFTMQVQ